MIGPENPSSGSPTALGGSTPVTGERTKCCACLRYKEQPAGEVCQCEWRQRTWQARHRNCVGGRSKHISPHARALSGTGLMLTTPLDCSEMWATPCPSRDSKCFHSWSSQGFPFPIWILLNTHFIFQKPTRGARTLAMALLVSPLHCVSECHPMHESHTRYESFAHEARQSHSMMHSVTIH